MTFHTLNTINITPLYILPLPAQVRLSPHSSTDSNTSVPYNLLAQTDATTGCHRQGRQSPLATHDIDIPTAALYITVHKLLQPT